MGIYDGMSEENLIKMISDEEIQSLINLKLETTGEPYEEEELIAIISWISMVRFEQALAELSVGGYILPVWDMDKDEPMFHATKLGKATLKGMDRIQVNDLLGEIFGDGVGEE